MLRTLLLPFIALTLLVLALPSHAQGWGIRFDQMPVGTEFEEQRQDGERFVNRFVGKQGKFYVVEKTRLKSGEKQRIKYSARGYIVSVSTTRGYRVKLTPHSCYRVVGSCTHYATGTIKDSGQFVYTAQKVGANSYAGTWRRVITQESRNFKYTTGKFNLVTYREHMQGARKMTMKITRISLPNG